MRKIKFRAWDKENNMMHNFDLGDLDGSLISIPDGKYHFKMKSIDKMKVMQFTGLLDKNGKEIFEGDIVKENVMDTNHKIDFYDGSFTFGLEVLNKTGIELFNLKVIGNIFENSELIKKRK